MTAGPQVSVSVVLALANIIDQYQTLMALDRTHKPCHIFDSINITGAYPLANGSYIHNGMIYPPHLVGEYDYTYRYLGERVETEPHLRGCICYIKNCTRMCCPEGSTWDSEDKRCADIGLQDNTKVNLTHWNGEDEEISIFDVFGVTMGQPCYKGGGYFLEPFEYETDKFQIYPDGRVKIVKTDVSFTKDQYCLAGRAKDENMTEWMLSPYVCFPTVKNDFITKVQYIKGLTILISIPFMIITIIVYTVIPELRNLHGKCLRCYLLSMVISGALIAFMKYKRFISDDVFCNVLAYVSYFFCLAAFFWLNVISFDLWWNFRGATGISRYNDRKRFVAYSLYSWSMPLAFAALAGTIQNISTIPNEFKIGFGEGEFCFIAASRWIQLFYLFGPILLIIIANAIMFIMTAIKIRKVQNEMTRITSKDDSRKNLEREKTQFGLFLRLFIIMGVTWSMETISWLAGNRLEWFFYVTDACNALMGVIIFFLFVVKKKIKDLIVKRYRSARGMTVNSTSMRTTSTGYSSSLHQKPSTKNNIKSIDQTVKGLMSESEINEA